MKVHRQTHRRRVTDNDVRAILRGQMQKGRPTDAATIRGLGVACGSCRLSRLRREIESEFATGIPVAHVARGSANTPAAARFFYTDPSNVGTNSEAAASAVAGVQVARPAINVAATADRSAVVGMPERAAADQPSVFRRDLLERIRWAAEALLAALRRRPSPQRNVYRARPQQGGEGGPTVSSETVVRSICGTPSRDSTDPSCDS